MENFSLVAGSKTRFSHGHRQRALLMCSHVCEIAHPRAYNKIALLNRTFAQLIRLVLFAALVLASVPIGATETVCVIGRGRVVPVAKCGMPCCEHSSPQTVPKRRSCCAGSSSAAVISPKKVCGWAGMSCRCETRLTVAAAPVFLSREVHAPLGFHQPANLPSTVFHFVSLAIVGGEQGILGSDSGPPRKRPRLPGQSRAPPSDSF